MIPFAYRKIKYTCPCSREVYAIDFVSVTSDFQLYVEWECSCGRHCQAMTPLEHLTQMAPEAPMSVTAVTVFDKEFARQMHIRLEG